MKKCLRNYPAARFNQLFPVGTSFRYYPVMGIPDSVEVTTSSESWELGDGTVVVKVMGRCGGVSVSHLEPLEPSL